MRTLARHVVSAAVLVMFVGAWLAPRAEAAVISPFFDAEYDLLDLGSVPGLPVDYGGLTFVDADTLLIGGAANTDLGLLYLIDVVRDGTGHVIGFSGVATPLGTVGEFNDGGVQFAPDGVLFTALWPVNQLGQTAPGSLDEDRVDDLAALGVAGGGPGGLSFVPDGFPGEGQLKLVTWPDGEWYTIPLTPDGAGTFAPGPATLETTLVGGPEGIFYVPVGSALFPGFNVLVAEWTAGTVGAYTVDANGNPIPGSRVDFITDLVGAEGGAVDPLTGDFFFSTFGGANQVIRVSGGFVPPPPVPEPATLVLLGGGLLVAVRRVKRSRAPTRLT